MQEASSTVNRSANIIIPLYSARSKEEKKSDLKSDTLNCIGVASLVWFSCFLFLLDTLDEEKQMETAADITILSRN